MARAFLCCLIALSCVACTRITVNKDPGPRDKGFRYYRPKPYLMITPGEPEKKSDKPVFTSQTTQGAPLQIATPPAGNAAPESRRESGQQAGYRDGVQPSGGTLPEMIDAGIVATDAVNLPVIEKPIKATISLMYLPDFAEEYSVRLWPGLGIGELEMKLDDGWKLTSVGMKTDQQTDEIISSVADLIGSVGGAFGGGDNKGAYGGQPIARVLATNIPFGLYEAVIAEDPCGRKQLYGWRYVGFMPFQACPVCPGGMQSVSCNDPTAIYGLVIDSSGTMRFEKIAEIPCLPQLEQTAQATPAMAEDASMYAARPQVRPLRRTSSLRPRSTR